MRCAGVYVPLVNMGRMKEGEEMTTMTSLNAGAAK